jgi:endonuclease YncB( thermonuclease family)
VGIVRLENGTILNEELLRKGHAWLYAAYCKTPRCVRWKSLELAARKARLGLWKAKKPIPPWKWRMRGKH